jgi:hypothetical protein
MPKKKLLKVPVVIARITWDGSDEIYTKLSRLAENVSRVSENQIGIQIKSGTLVLSSLNGPLIYITDKHLATRHFGVR